MPAIRLTKSRDSAVLLPLLRDAEEGDARIVQVLEDSANSAYLALSGNTPRRGGRRALDVRR